MANQGTNKRRRLQPWWVKIAWWTAVLLAFAIIIGLLILIFSIPWYWLLLGIAAIYLLSQGRSIGSVTVPGIGWKWVLGILIGTGVLLSLPSIIGWIKTKTETGYYAWAKRYYENLSEEEKIKAGIGWSTISQGETKYLFLQRDKSRTFEFDGLENGDTVTARLMRRDTDSPRMIAVWTEGNPIYINGYPYGTKEDVDGFPIDFETNLSPGLYLVTVNKKIKMRFAKEW